MKLYTLHDMVSKSFFAPFAAANHSAASRSVATAAIMDNTIVSQHPSDFELFYLGDYDENTAHLTPTVAPVPIALVAALVEDLKSRLPSSGPLHA